MSRPTAYKGNDPYIFVSYCHKDDARVWPMIEGLQKRGMRVWYDEGIEWGSHWDQVIFEHLSGCACVVAFVTENFLQSENCMDEISFAKDEQKGPFIVFLDNLELTGMMKYRYGRIQALNLHQFADKDALLDNLVDAQILASCRGTTVRSASSSPVPQQPVPAPKPAPQQTVPAYQPSHPSDADLTEWNRKGEMYFNKKEYTEAVKWFRKAAEQGHAKAQCKLGWCYGSYGTGIHDGSEALKWFRKAAEQGYAEAQCKLGSYYFHGLCVKQDYVEAAQWYHKAAEQGDHQAQGMLAMLYEEGWGVKKDKIKAKYWRHKASKW